MISFQQIEAKRKPWVPQLIKPESTRFPGKNLDVFIQKSIALSLKLEIEVAEWVIEARKQLKSKDVPEEAMTTLYRNIRDESVHFKAFQNAGKAYGIGNFEDEAENIYKSWESISNTIHPLWVAAMAETGVFLTNLAILRLCGGDGLSAMSGEIARDEYRHVGTNRAILNYLGENLHKPPTALDKLREETVDWLFDGLEVSALDIDKQWLLDQSDELTYIGEASELSELTSHCEYVSPFEVSNSRLY